jgi:hypothetical protein
MLADPTALAERIRGLNSNVLESSEHLANEGYPYRFRQSFYLPLSHFSVELSVNCKAVPGGFELSSRIVASDSMVLAVFQTIVVDESLPVPEMQSRIDEWVRRLCAFLTAEAPMVVGLLEEVQKLAEDR